MDKWKRETFEKKEAVELKNSGNSVTEQKSGASASEIFEQMLYDGSITNLLKLKAGGQVKAMDLETAIAQAQKHPNLIDLIDIEQANDFIESMKEKLNKKMEAEKEIEKLKTELAVESAVEPENVQTQETK